MNKLVAFLVLEVIMFTIVIVILSGTSSLVSVYNGVGNTPVFSTTGTAQINLSGIEYGRVEVVSKGLLPLKVCEVSRSSNKTNVHFVYPGWMRHMTSTDTISVEVMSIWDRCTK